MHTRVLGGLHPGAILSPPPGDTWKLLETLLVFSTVGAEVTPARGTRRWGEAPASHPDAVRALSQLVPGMAATDQLGSRAVECKTCQGVAGSGESCCLATSPSTSTSGKC